MKIGIICEGRSDYPAIECFFGDSLAAEGIDASFRPLFPKMDNTRPGDGWANVLHWLNSNLPESRIPRFFGGGLFAGPLATDRLDAIVVHLDADILGHPSFCAFVEANYGFVPACPEVPSERAAEIANVLRHAMRRDQMSNGDNAKHVDAIAVEATESWCVAAFHPQASAYESLSGQQLATAFMRALERFEGREPQETYANASKDFNRRYRYCKFFGQHSQRIYNSCDEFRSARDRLVALATP